MKELCQIVTSYLDDPHVDYALMVVGPWGSGKTFYWRNVLEPEIKKRLVQSTRKPQRVAYVSLYGLMQPEDIDREILFALHPTLGSRGAKVVGSVAQLGLKFFGVETEGAKLDIADWTRFDDVVLCFDDLERCSIPVADVLGYINRYVEHKLVKTVLLCNEDAIRADDR